MSVDDLRINADDAKWAGTFVALYMFMSTHPKSEDAVLLLSTCRNAYLTINAEFADIQELLGGATASPLRSALEMIHQGSLNGAKIKSRFQGALATIAQIDIKERVWSTRHELHESLLRLLEEYEAENPLESAYIASIIRGVDVGPSDPENGRHADLLRLDLSVQPHLQTYFGTLKRLRDLLEAVARLGMSYADTLSGPEASAVPGTIDLFVIDDALPESQKDESAKDEVRTVSPVRTVAHWAEKISSICGWTTQSVGESILSVTVDLKHKRPEGADANTDYIFNLAATDGAIARSDAVAFLREALWCAHWIATSTFKPNVASRPMPAVFDVLLPVNRPSPTNADIQPLRLDPKACGGERRTPNSVRVALAHLSVPVSEFNLNDYRFTEEVTREAVEADFVQAVGAARSHECHAVVFPEYSIPQSLRDRLLQIASNGNVTIIGGFEGAWRDDKLVDEVFVAIPGEPTLYNQFKHSPSLDEQSAANMFHDGCLRLFMNSPIGNFAVVVCSDFLESATLEAWSLTGPLPDILFVVARNNYTELYEHFAITDSFRLYCSVVVSNVRDEPEPANSEGSYVVSPRRTKAIDLGTDVFVDGTYLKRITVHDIPISSIRARERGKPVPHFFTVPRSAKRA